MIHKRRQALKAIGEKNELDVLRFLCKFTYSTPSIIQQWIKLSKQGTYKLISRMEAKNHVCAATFDNGLGKKKIVGITHHGLVVVASDIMAHDHTGEAVQKASSIEARQPFKISKFSETQFKHHIAIQNFVIDFKQNQQEKYNLKHVKKIINIETEREIKQQFNADKKSSIRKYPDIILHVQLDSGKESKIAIELELTPKSKLRYQSIIKNHHQHMLKNYYDSVLYIMPKNIKSIQNNIQFFAEKFSDVNRFTFAELVN